MWSLLSTSNFLLPSIIIPFLSRRRPYTVSIFFSFHHCWGNFRCILNPADPSCDNDFRLSDVCIWCWTDVVNESFVVSKTYLSFILQLRSLYAVWTLSLVNLSRCLTYVASIYAIRLTRDLPRCFLISSSSYSISCPFGQTTFWRPRHAARFLLRAC